MKINLGSVVMSPFARARHTPEAPRSHFAGTEEELLSRVQRSMKLHWIGGAQLMNQVLEEAGSPTRVNNDYVLPGYKEGVIKVVVSPLDFFTPVRELKAGDTGKWEFVARQEGEDPRIELYVEGAMQRLA